MTKTIKSKVLISALFVALLCILLSVVIVLPTSAEELTPTASGSCGENATWEYYESTGELKILGSGAMTNYSSSNAPWYSYRSNIKTVTVAEGITSIGNYAFYYCNSLTNIEIPSSVTSIGNYAFQSCSSLTSIEIPSSVKSIGFRAFQNCTSLTSIEIPSSVTSIGNGVVEGCSALATLAVEDGNTVYHSKDNCIIQTNTKTLIAGCKNSIIPADGSVAQIGNYAFAWCYDLTSIEIPSTVTSIGNNAFAWCDDLTSIEIPSSVTSLGKNVFYTSTGLQSITVDGNNPNYMSLDGNLYSKDGTELIQYALGKTDTSFEIPEGVTIISSGAFKHSKNLKNITIPDGVVSIGDGAFHCTSIVNITIPKSVTKIESWAFGVCSATSITVDEDNPNYTSIDGNLYSKDGTTFIQYAGGKKDTSFIVPEGVNSIGVGAFAGYLSLISIEIPSSVTSIGSSAFLNCRSLTSITLLSETPATLGSSVFSSGYPVEAIYVPASAVDTYKSCTGWAEYKDMIFPLEAEKATISFGEYKVKTGKTVSVTVSLENNPGIAIASITLDYDKTALTLKEVENGEIFNTLDSGLNLLWSADANCEGNGVLATLTFEVNENAEAKDYTISARVNEAYNEDSEKVDIAVSDGKIAVYKFIYGDANDDDTVSAIDVLLLRKYMANYDYEKGTSSIDVARGADANGDGNVTALDVLLMRKYMANYDYDTGTSSIVLGPKS